MRSLYCATKYAAQVDVPDNDFEANDEEVARLMFKVDNKMSRFYFKSPRHGPYCPHMNCMSINEN